MRFKLIALDIDGTLLNSRREIGPRTQKSLQEAASAGLRLVLCTGRPYRSTMRVIDMIGIRPLAIVNGGSLVKDSQTHETIYRNGLPYLLVAAILNFLKGYDVSPILFLDAFPHGPDFMVEDDKSGKPEYLRYVKGGAPHYGVSAGFHQAHRDRLLEIALFDRLGGLRDLLSRAKMEFRRRITAHVLQFDRYQYKSDCLEILNAGVSKWSALIHVAENLGITAKEIIAIGDDVNDLEMIAQAGLGVAMGNAVPAVVRASRLQAPTNDQDGVAWLVNQILNHRTPDQA